MAVVLQVGSRSRKQMSLRLRSTTEDQRLLLDAARGLLIDQGPQSLTVAAICTRAGVSRPRFYAAFAGREDLTVALFDDLGAEIGSALLAAYGMEKEWVDSVRAALRELLTLFDESPQMARFLIVSSLAGGALMLAHRASAAQTLVAALELGSPLVDPVLARPSFGAEALVGTVAAVLHARLLEEPVPPLQGLCGSLMGMIVLSRRGTIDARSELCRAETEPHS
jgi:AcrR family transcriptional regulator